MLFHLECAIIFEGTLKFMETPRHTMHFLVITGHKYFNCNDYDHHMINFNILLLLAYL